MLATDAVSSNLLVNLILGGFGVSGLIGAGVALFKLRPDVNSAAVSQAQGAMETMRQLNDELVDSLKRANDARDFYRKQAEVAEERVAELEAKLQGRHPPEQG